MANFNTAFNLTMGHEGGYANNPLDTGGETYKGIARNHNPNWLGWQTIDSIKSKIGKSATVINTHAAKDLTLQDQVKKIYKSNYWDTVNLDKVNYQDIANTLFDISVNMGFKVAAKFLQEALNLCNRNGKEYPDLLIDGQIGNVTLSTLNNKANSKAVFNTINLLKGEKYIGIMRANKSQENFWASWLKRVVLL